MNDLRKHQDSTFCWCNPLIVGDSIVVHHAADLREKDERAGKIDPAKKWEVVLL